MKNCLGDGGWERDELPFYKIFALRSGPIIIVVRVSMNVLPLEQATWYFV